MANDQPNGNAEDESQRKMRFGHGIGIGGETQTITILNTAIKDLSEAQPEDIQKIAASQIELLVSYYYSALEQAETSFKWAVIAAIAGFGLFVATMVYVGVSGSSDVALVGLVGGAIVEVVAGLNFYLYGMASKQLASFHQRLDQTQRFMLANSICERIEGEQKWETRAQLVMKVASFGPGWEEPQQETKPSKT